MCGIAGAWNVADAYNVLHDLLLALQHRGQQAAGVVIDGFRSVKGSGLVEHVLTDERHVAGRRGIGHVRYSTHGSPSEVQPIMAHSFKGTIAIAHNGNIYDASERRKYVMENGGIFSTTMDSELFVHYFSLAPYKDVVSSLQWTFSRIQAAYSLVALHESYLVASRDLFGIRPLFYGNFEGGYVVASEDSALHSIGATEVLEVEPGTMVIFNETSGPEVVRFAERNDHFCSFEFVYFARPDSSFYGINVHELRKELGRKLYEETKLQVDIVVPVLDSGFSGAIGFSNASKIPLDYGLIRNHYVGRSFIMPRDRQNIVKRKLSPIDKVVQGRRVLLIDDSIVRGTTMRVIVEMVREAGASSVHVGIHSPPVVGPCQYGIDTSRRSELLASNSSVEEMRMLIGADGLHFLSIEGFKEVFASCKVRGICTGCFDLKYPTG